MRSPRYGRRIRKLAGAATKKKVSSYECPKCAKKSVKRISYALWKCRSCGTKIAGGAYSLSTATGQTARRMIQKGNAGEE